jgi:hypothetical protein
MASRELNLYHPMAIIGVICVLCFIFGSLILVFGKPIWELVMIGSVIMGASLGVLMGYSLGQHSER